MQKLPLPLLFASLGLLPGGCSFGVDPKDVAQDLGVVEDLSTVAPPPDLSLSDPPDLVPPGPCFQREKERLCINDMSPAMTGSCGTDQTLRLDRVCTGNGCDQSGHCRDPKSAVACQNDQSCAGVAMTTCQPFTNLFNLYRLFCAPPPGTKGSMEPCEKHADCKWNICGKATQDGPTVCLKTCASDADCGGQPGSCRHNNALFIEGQLVTIMNCFK